MEGLLNRGGTSHRLRKCLEEECRGGEELIIVITILLRSPPSSSSYTQAAPGCESVWKKNAEEEARSRAAGGASAELGD